MRRVTEVCGFALLLVWTGCDARPPLPAEPASDGIVVEEPPSGRTGDAAGFEEDDVLLSWERGGAVEPLSGPLHDPFDYVGHAPKRFIVRATRIPRTEQTD